MKAVLLSIRPKWCKKIANRRKTIEIRKTAPNLEVPFKCYIYCTQSGVALGAWGKHGKVIGEFTCDRIDRLAPANEPYGIYDIDDDYVLQTCLGNGALWDYGHGTPLYGWHISDLRIYDTPRELVEFERPYDCDKCDAVWATTCNQCSDDRKIKFPPQSWFYVEEM